MPYFVFRGWDAPGTEEIRSRLRETHRVYIRQEAHGARVVAGGPIVDDEGQAMNGSLLVLEGPDRASVEAFLAGDPYASEPLFERTEVVRWQWGLGQPTPTP